MREHGLSGEGAAVILGQPVRLDPKRDAFVAYAGG
jgi:hypothetical protein